MTEITVTELRILRALATALKRAPGLQINQRHIHRTTVAGTFSPLLVAKAIAASLERCRSPSSSLRMRSFNSPAAFSVKVTATI